MIPLTDDGKLVAESDSGEFWLLFGGFAPIGKKAISEDDIVLERTVAKLYRYSLMFYHETTGMHIPFLLQTFAGLVK